MKIETHIKLERELLDAIDNLSGGEQNRSELIEAALQLYIKNLPQHAQSDKDREIIEHYAHELNEEALDVLDYQVAL